MFHIDPTLDTVPSGAARSCDGSDPGPQMRWHHAGWKARVERSKARLHQTGDQMVDTESRSDGAKPGREGTSLSNSQIVLLVDDHRDTLEMYAEALTIGGLSTALATTAEDALRRAVTIRPAVIVTDLSLGAGATGLQLCEQLKGDPATCGTPVIVVTGWDTDRELQTHASAGGCVEVLRKPVSPDALVAAVLRAIAATRS